MPYKDPNDRKSFQRAWVKARREEWILENGPCVVCESTENLVVDHIDPKQKYMNPTKLWSLSIENPIRIAELAKCQVLCLKHHKEKTHAEQSPDAPHGTYRKYSKLKCRCPECRKANADYKYNLRLRSTIWQCYRLLIDGL